MAGIKLYRSNSIEELVDALSENVKTPLSSPFAPEIILVQSLGMAKWLNLEMAKRLGIWANGKLLFPNTLINTLFAKVLPDIDERLFLDRDKLTWMILDLLVSSKIGSNKSLAHLAKYCKAQKIDNKIESKIDNTIEVDEVNFRAFQLARQLAMIFDQYLIYRTHLIELWETSEIDEDKYGNIANDNNWQMMLWRYISTNFSFTHKAARKKDFLDAIKFQKPTDKLPERISIFGIPSLPLFHLDILASLSDFLDVSFYVMTPAQGYFSDLKSAKEKMKRENIEGYYFGVSPELLHIESGNSLLSSLGRAGADFMESLLNYDKLVDIDIKFIEPKGNTILSMVQQDILLMQDRKEHLILRDDIKKDRSILINSCHSPMREVEVLNDYLLELFDSNSDITPADVLVMTPDIETYAPFIRAIFTTPEDDRLKIGFSIADLNIKSVSRIVDLFMDILSLSQSRFEASFIVDMLECDAVARRFSLEPKDIDVVRSWIKKTAIRWGRDGKQKEDIGLPCFEENSWRAGLNRLMAGYAMVGHEERFFNNILPCDLVEGGTSRVLGSLSCFFNTLSKVADNMSKKMSLTQWSDLLMEVVDDLFLVDQNSDNGSDNGSDSSSISMVQEIRDALSELKQIEEITKFDPPVSSRIIKSWCDRAIGREYRDSNFLNGRVTFCAMLPMRSIPAKVICILGLNDGIFPRIDSAPNFDLIRQHPMRGDRSLRNEDRYLFLETLISARERLYLSYTGQGVEDNSTILPSVVVSELIDYLDEAFCVDGVATDCINQKKISSYIIKQHRLQPFSPAYFNLSESGLGLFSYSKSNCDAAKALIGEKSDIKPFISAQSILQSTDSASDYDLISINNLINFFLAPQRYFLENSLSIYLKDEGERLEESEPFSLDNLESYGIKDEMLKQLIKSKEPSDCKMTIDIYRAKGLLPHGAVGEVFYGETQNGVKSFFSKIADYIKEGRSSPIEVDLNGNGWRLKGIISDLWGNRLVRFRIASVKPKDILRAWIIHLSLLSFFQDRVEEKSLIIGSDKIYNLLKPCDPLSILDTIIKIYQKGVKSPLKFFPESSMAYADTIFKNKNGDSLDDQNLKDAALKKAKDKFKNSFNNIGEGESEDIKLCFRHLETPLDEEFCDLSTAIWRPILSYLEEKK
ncbi:MAG: exodeoxyribonuclease V subunit gamma [Desulfamplus sp.]|nr:exodeoxyribonuclease V subunit gamma [Desulfamplus sp.]